MQYKFFALISRMRYIARWGLMRNTFQENIQEHSHMVAVLAHALALIERDILGGTADPDRCATAALFHDASEILTGDLPTPIKYFNPEIKKAYKQVEAVSCEKLLGLLPQELQKSYEPLLFESDEKVGVIVKAADKLSAYLKCVEELKAGNTEFTQAEKQTYQALVDMKLPCLDYFMEHFLHSFRRPHDSLSNAANHTRAQPPPARVCVCKAYWKIRGAAPRSSGQVFVFSMVCRSCSGTRLPPVAQTMCAALRSAGCSVSGARPAAHARASWT